MSKLYLLPAFVGEYFEIRAMIYDCDKYEGFGIIAQKNINTSEELYGCNKIVYLSHGMTYIPNDKLVRIQKNFNKLNTAFNKQYNKDEWTNNFIKAVISLILVSGCEKKLFVANGAKEKEIAINQFIETKWD